MGPDSDDDDGRGDPPNMRLAFSERASCGSSTSSSSSLGLIFGPLTYDWSAISPRPKTPAGKSSSSSLSTTVGLVGFCWFRPAMVPEFEFVRDSRFSRLIVLFLLCPSPSQPLLPKLPFLISARDGAAAVTFAVASHMPAGGADSMNRRDALRSLPVVEAPEEPRFRVRSLLLVGLEGDNGEVGRDEEIS